MKVDACIETVFVGLGATFVLDLWTVFLSRAFAIPFPNYCFIGRWLRHMANGVFAHPSIAAATQQPAECPIGWIAHYTIGALFALALVALVTPRWLQLPTLAPALVFGIVTVGFPFFVMHPAFGLGLAASKAPNPTQARLRTITNHVVFGFGMYLSAFALSALIEPHA